METIQLVQIPLNTRIEHTVHGPGVIVAYDTVHNQRTQERDWTGRYGIVFDNHTLLANPAYFWPSGFKVV